MIRAIVQLRGKKTIIINDLRRLNWCVATLLLVFL